MLFLGILYWFRKSLPRSIYSISILLLEFIFPFVRPSEYIIIPEVCAQGWYSSSTPVLFVEFGSFFLTFFFIFSSHFCTFLANLRFFVEFTDFFVELTHFFVDFFATDGYALPLNFLKSLPADFFLTLFEPNSEFHSWISIRWQDPNNITDNEKRCIVLSSFAQ